MFKSASTKGSGPAQYERLEKEFADTIISNEELKRSTTVPSSGASSSKAKMAMDSTTFGDINLQRNPTKKISNQKEKSTTHPLFGFFDFRRKKKTTSKPEFARYLEYVKEGGMWDSESNKPVIYYK